MEVGSFHSKPEPFVLGAIRLTSWWRVGRGRAQSSAAAAAAGLRTATAAISLDSP